MSLHCIVWCCMVLYCWLRRAGCISQDTYLLYCICIWEILQKNYSRPVSKVIICFFIILYIHIYVWILFDFVALTAALYVTIRQYWSKGPHPRHEQKILTMCALCIVTTKYSVSLLHCNSGTECSVFCSSTSSESSSHNSTQLKQQTTNRADEQMCWLG